MYVVSHLHLRISTEKLYHSVEIITNVQKGNITIVFHGCSVIQYVTLYYVEKTVVFTIYINELPKNEKCSFMNKECL